MPEGAGGIPVISIDLTASRRSILEGIGVGVTSWDPINKTPGRGRGFWLGAADAAGFMGSRIRW